MLRLCAIFLLLLLAAPIAAAEDDAKPAKDAKAVEGKGKGKANALPAKRKVDELPTPPPLKGPNALVTKKGSRVQGRFEGIEKGRFIFNDPEVGKVKVRSSNVHSMLLRDPYRVWFQETPDSDVKEGRLAPIFYRNELGDQRLRLHAWGEEGLDEYLLLHPSDMHKLQLKSYSDRNRKWKFTGNISTSLEWADGNHTRTNYGINSRFKLQHPQHVFETRESFSYAETDAARSLQRGNAEFSYRFLFTTYNAIFIREVLTHDDFAKLAVRSITSTGLTFYFYKETDITWSIDLGASYTEEHRKRGTPNRYSDGGQISTRFDSKPIDDVRVIFSSRATIPFDYPKEAIITSELNVSFLVWEGLTMGFNVRHNHDSEPPVNVEHNDYNLRFLLGWSFT